MTLVGATRVPGASTDAANHDEPASGERTV